MAEKNPYPLLSIHRMLWHIRQPSNPAHRMFWGVGMESDKGIYSIYWCGIITLWWDANLGWSWSWNFD